MSTVVEEFDTKEERSARLAELRERGHRSTNSAILQRIANAHEMGPVLAL